MTPCLLLVLVFTGPVQGGPLTNPHPNMTDQELFWGADQYDFSVVLPAAGMECFWHFAHRGERFYLSFMVRTNAACCRYIVDYFSVRLNIHYKMFSHFKSIRIKSYLSDQNSKYRKLFIGNNKLFNPNDRKKIHFQAF